MTFNSAALKLMLDKGLTLADVVEIAVANERRSDPTNADRQARYRERKRNAVTSRVTPPKENISNPHSVSDETGGSPPDPVAQMFDMGVAMLKSQGHDERKARSIIGSWRKGRSPGDVVAGLIDAKTRSISNLVEWMPKRLSGTRQTGPPDFMEHYEREMQRRTIASPA